MMIAKAIKYPDLVVGQTTYSPIDNIRLVKPDVLMESGSHKGDDIKENQKVLDEWGGRIISMPYYPELSSTEIKGRIKGN